MLVEYFTIKMNANISLHVFRAIIQDLVGIKSFGHCPSTNYVIHNPFAECLRYLMQLHEFPDVVEHVVVLGCCRRHLLDYRRDVTENCSVEKSCKAKDLLYLLNSRAIARNYHHCSLLHVQLLPATDKLLKPSASSQSTYASGQK